MREESYVVVDTNGDYHHKYSISNIVNLEKFWEAIIKEEKSIALQTYDNVKGWYDAYTLPYKLVLPFEEYKKFVNGEIDEVGAKLRQKRAIIITRIKL